jgi:hypothetical protein
VKVLVCGGRDYDNRSAVYSALRRLHEGHLLIASTASSVIHGDARGADSMAGRWARDNGVQEISCPANWEYWGNRAGPMRNAAMLMLRPDIVLAFPGGRGTADMVRRAKDAGIEVIEVTQ